MNRSSAVAGLVAVVLAAAIVSHANDLRHDRIARIEAMSVAEKAELNQKLERYQNLSPEQKEKLAALDASLEQHPEGELLREVMRRYYAWLKTLNPVERANLEKLPIAERIQEIKRLIGNQERQNFMELARDVHRDIKPSREDFSAIHNWLHDWLKQHEGEILAAEDKVLQHAPWLKERLERASSQRKIYELWLWMTRLEEVADLKPSEAEFQELAAKLQDDTRERLQLQPAARQPALLEALMWTAVLTPIHMRIDEEDLQEFYQQLPEQRQAELVVLSPDEFDRELRKEYMKHRGYRVMGRPSGPPPWNRDGRRGDGRDDRRGNRSERRERGEFDEPMRRFSPDRDQERFRAEAGGETPRGPADAASPFRSPRQGEPPAETDQDRDAS